MIRLSLALSLAAALCVMTSTANAAEPADSGVSQSALSAMGLGSMRTMDDQESAQIRGQGSITFGVSYATTSFNLGPISGSAGSINGYYNNFNNFSGGFSFAGANSTITPFIYGTGFSLGGGF